MKQTIFETKLRADELLKKAIEVWRKSDQSETLEEMETDPVISLLMTALAYQANELENNLDQMKADVLEEFAHMLTPYETGHAIPATALVATALSEQLEEMEMGTQHIFTLGEQKVEFMPLLRSRVLNATLESTVRLDGRRWKVTLLFRSPVTDLSGFCFAIKNQNYRDVDVPIDGETLPIIKPWDYSDLPMSPCFSIDSIFYNRSMTCQPSPVSLDLFAWQNVRNYCVAKRQGGKDTKKQEGKRKLELIFEFSGIPDDFTFDKNSLVLNTVLLVNAKMHTATLSATNPIVRVAGFDTQAEDSYTFGRQFLHLLRPAEEQLFGDTPIEVRRMAGDRFNQGALVKMLNHLLNRYYSDFYAFQNIQEVVNDKVVHGLAEILQRLHNATKKKAALNVPGVYLMLQTPLASQPSPLISLDVSYVTTAGASINDLLTSDSIFTPPTGFEGAATRLVTAPMLGVDEIRDNKIEASLRRYYMTTHDRLVTPADIKQFCYHQLLTRYNIVRDMVKSITISHRQQQESRQCGYEIMVEIVLMDNAFVKRGFTDKIQQVEVMLKSMMNVRSANIYPIQVMIRIDNS